MPDLESLSYLISAQSYLHQAGYVIWNSHTNVAIFFRDHLSKSGQTLNIKSSEAIVKTIQNM